MEIDKTVGIIAKDDGTKWTIEVVDAVHGDYYVCFGITPVVYYT